MKAIVAVDKNWGIGKNNDLLFSIPEDMKFFRSTTLNKVVVMGGNTLRSFPNGNPLKNRINVVLSTRINREDCIIARSYSELFEIIKRYESDEVFVIGGASVYREMLPFIDEILVTKVEADGKADVFFENLDKLDNFKVIFEGEEQINNGYKFRFTTYKNTAVKSF
ncbi:MAG: dihydrofolate reductase [Clostridia bacterium]|nr:dihydrofolate reductase [Clostridia bacterium]